MKTGKLSYLIAAMLAGFSVASHAEAMKDNPYQLIIDRNPFQLKPIPPPPPPATNIVAEAPPAPKVFLTGLTTLLGVPKVFLQLENAQTKKMEFVSMKLGERQGDIEVLEVNVEGGTVRLRNGDAESTLDFEKNGLKATAVASAAAVPPPGGMANPGFVPANINNVNNPSSRAIVTGGGAMPTASVATPASPFGNNGGAIPPRAVRGDFGNNVIVSGAGQSGAPAAQPVQPAAPTLSRDDVMARIEAQRQILLQKEQTGQAPVGTSRILPPTPFSPPSAPGGSIPAPPTR